MAFHCRYNVHNLYIFIFFLFSTEFLLNCVQCLEQSRFYLPQRFNNKLSFDEFIPLINDYKPVLLSIGTPNILPPAFLREALLNVTSGTDASVHQYLPPQGSLEFRSEIAGLHSKLINRTLDPSENVVVTIGATEALYLTLLVHTSPGDEWIVIEPAFEGYYSAIKMTGGIVRPISLKLRTTEGEFSSADLVLDKDEVEKAFNERTKGIIVNNPNNPTGKVFTKEELLFIAKLAIKWDTLIISDEVYEWMIFDPNVDYIRMASLGDEIFNRTITITSMSKTYFATGWRLGWAYGPSKLIKNLSSQQTAVLYSLNTYSQLAAAKGLRKMRFELGDPDSYFRKLAKSLKEKRDFMLEVLNKIGVESIVPESGYYIFANWTRLEPTSSDLDLEVGASKDIKFTKWLIKKTRIAVASGTAFYYKANKKIGEDFIRICFAKEFETLETAAKLLLNRFF